MLNYLAKRILFAIPTLLLISVVIFGLSRFMPAYEEEMEPPLRLEQGRSALRFQEQQSRYACEKFGLHLPSFYFSLQTAALPDSLHRIFPPSRREFLSTMAMATGNWPLTEVYGKAYRQLALNELLAPESVEKQALHDVMMRMLLAKNVDDLVSETSKMGQIPLQDASLMESVRACHYAALQLQAQQTPEKMYYPKLVWYGSENQYHRWFRGIFTGNMGYGTDDRLISQSLLPSLMTTLIISILAMFLTFLIAIPLGVYMAKNERTWRDRWLQRLLLLLYSLPGMGMGILLMALLGISQFLPPRGNDAVLPWILGNFDALILPIMALVLNGLTLLAFQMRGSILNQMKENFIRAARAKGVSENQIYWQHAFRNALFPIITVFAATFPSVFTGALVIEYLFNIPGMGSKAQAAISGNNYPLMYVMLMLSALVTILANFLADVLYAWADPRVRFQQ
jgi:peptide/nickel transport system permease protein